MFKDKLAVLGLVMLVVYCSGEELYSDKYDDVDVDQILAMPRLRDQYYKCIAGESRCITPDARFIKEHFREAIVTNCRRCTEKQKVALSKVTIYFAENEPEKYKVIVEKTIEDARKHRLG